MFWKYNSLAVSQIDSLLEKQDVTLAEILQQEDIIQECKSQNKKLVEFLTKQEILSELLDLILQEPPEDLDEKQRYMLPNIASELITCDVPQINEKLSSDASLLDKMYSFLEGEPPLNPLLTSFFSKAFGVLITRRSDQNWYSYQYTCLQVVEYIKTKPNFTSLLLKHLSTSAVMDLLLRLITCVEGTETKQNILGWLNSERLIERVVGLLAPEENSHNLCTHDNAGQLLVEIIRVSRDSQLAATPAERFLNPLLATAESPQTVELLLSHMMASPARESVIVNGVNVLLCLLEIRRPGPINAGYYPYTTVDQETAGSNDADISRQLAVLEKTVETILPHLSSLSNLLRNPPEKPPFRTTAGLLDPPLGATRLALAKLFSTLLSTYHPPLNVGLAETSSLDLLLDLFFKYSLNNFLHSQVEACVRHVLFWKFAVSSKPEEEEVNVDTLQTPKVATESENPLLKPPVDNPLLVHLFSNSRLVERVLGAFEDNEENSASMGRKGYMGHLTKIANAIVSACTEVEEGKCSESRDILLEEMKKLPENIAERWNKFITGSLDQLNKLNEIKTMQEDKRNSSSDDEDADFRDINFPQDTALQQMQQMSDNFIESFGFSDEEFTDADENIGSGMRKLTNVNFPISTDETSKQQEIFEAACEQRVTPFRSSPTHEDGEDDPWSERTAEISFGAGVTGSPIGNLSPVRPGSPVSRQNNELGGAAPAAAVVSPGGGAANAVQDADSDDEDGAGAPAKMEVDSEQDPWESTEATPVAMDTASPWGETDINGTASQQTEGWADFGGFSSAGGEGFANFSTGEEKQESMEEGNGDRKDQWSPAMVSSPEATTLDDPSSPDRREETDAEDKYTVPRPASPDIADTNANPAPVPSDQPDEKAEAPEATDNFSFSHAIHSSQENVQSPVKSEEETPVSVVMGASGPA